MGSTMQGQWEPCMRVSSHAAAKGGGDELTMDAIAGGINVQYCSVDGGNKHITIPAGASTHAELLTALQQAFQGQGVPVQVS